MGKIGVGKKVQGRRGQFVLNSVTTEGKVIFTHTEQMLTIPETINLIYGEEPDTGNDTPFRLTLTLETPLRLKFENRLTSQLPFHVLVRTMMRRVSSLLACYGDSRLSIDYQKMVKLAEEVQIVDNQLKWFDWRRYSTRHEKFMLMGGMVGNVTYEGKLSPFMNLIDLCSHVHIGKQTAFGLGKFKAELNKNLILKRREKDG